MLKNQQRHFPDIIPISIFIALALIMLKLGLILFFGNAQFYLLVSNLLMVLFNLIASGALLAAALRSWTVSKRLGIIWGIFFIAQMFNGIGDTLWGYHEVFLNEPAFPSSADWFYLSYYPLMLAGILLLPARPATRIDRIKKVIDIWIIIIASLLFFYNFLIGPFIDPVAEINLEHVLLLAYPIGDLVLLWGILLLLFNYQGHKTDVSLILLGISFSLLILADLFFSKQILSSSPYNGQFVGLGLSIVYMLSALAGVCQIRYCQQPKEKILDALPDNFVQRTVAFSPYIWVFAAFTLLIISHYQSLPMSFSWITLGVGLIITLVLLRQFFTMAENQKLNTRLNLALSQMQLQADDLHTANEDLSRQISKRKRAEEELSRLALYDSLTGLPNRVLFMDRLNHAIEYARRHLDWNFSILFLDLDQFKVINDSLGHTIGDELLIEVASRLTSCLRPTDTVARFGGDEFIILLEGTQSDQAAVETSRRILKTLNAPFTLQDHEVISTSSIGIVPQVNGNHACGEIIRDADIAMYRAKALGKDQYVIFTSQLLDQAVTRLQMENELRQALENQEYLIYYQPIFSAKDEEILGFEALIRWNHPKRGIITPCEFMPVAEETGLIVEINEWVLRTACSQINRWNQITEGKEYIINVNIASKQFSQSDFVNRVEKILKDTQLNPSCLRLEITERVVIENLPLANTIFSQLQASGVKIQVDDFGTGYSSLSYLQHLPIQGIKIDMSFIHEMEKPGKSPKLVKSILSMAKDLGMTAIAEGVENENQMQILRDLSCEYVQGFYLAIPLDAPSTEELIFRRQKCS